MKFMRIEDYVIYLVCPVCGTNLSVIDKNLVCNGCGERYEIRDNIPILLPKSVHTTNDEFINLYNTINETEKYDFEVDERGKVLENFILKDSLYTDKIVIDMGGGKGQISKKLKTARMVFCLDLSISALNKIYKNNENMNILPICVDIHNNCLNVDADIIVCTEVLEHVQNPERCLKIFNSSLKNSGLLIISVPVLNLPFKQLCISIFRRVTEKNVDKNEHLRVFSTDQLILSLKKAGFNVEKIKHYNLFSKLSGINDCLDRLFAHCVYVACRKNSYEVVLIE